MGKLILIPTPIGNLEDITLRAIKVLKEVNLILAEDTRVSKKLLKHLNISTPVTSFHQYNEHKNLQKWIDFLKRKNTIGLISDAGTPAISDPGFLLVRECVKNKIIIECLPGPTALIPAVVNSGIPCERFAFEGFLPTKKGRKKRLKELVQEKRTIVFFESPHKILKTLQDFENFFGANRQVAISRELTKIFEETIRGTITEVLDQFKNQKPKGEFTIVLEGKK